MSSAPHDRSACSKISLSSAETASSSLPCCVDLGEQLRDLPLKIGLDVANALRLAAERLGRVQQRIVIELDERLERDAEPLAVIEQGAVVIGNPPRPWIEIEAFLKFAGLRRAAEFGEPVAAAQRPVAAAGAAVEFQHLHLVAGLAQFQCRRHAGKTGAEDQHRGAFGIAARA